MLVPAESESGDHALLTPLPVSSRTEERNWRTIDIDVVPTEPPVEPLPELIRAYRAREPWTEGRLIITPHSAFFSPQAWEDTRRLAAETMKAALLGPKPQNVIAPEGW